MIVEDTAEIDMWHRERHPLFHSLEVREPNSEGEGGIQMAELVKQTLRHRPDWFCVGECRYGDTAAEMLKAMTSGHSSLTTVHAESARGGIAKLALMLALSESQLNLSVANNLISEGVDLMCHVVRDAHDGRRYISELIEVAGFDGNQAVVNQIYRAADTRFGYARVATFSPPLEDRLSRLGLDLAGFYRACGAIQEVAS